MFTNTAVIVPNDVLTGAIVGIVRVALILIIEISSGVLVNYLFLGITCELVISLWIGRE